ncbi:M23 family metallopeptidase [Streptomyces malaysiense]|uniref:Peptidase M23 n=1 Tax=Streptomyces malaysiense TaxID=1428626 RepID=A0A1J4Q6L6_9ACTN|nr:M23 family metallopeptidase [Streptomyces malaysiense]OIK28164.1 peptidase M23 [Streptomyces malaysiense]
MNDRHPSGTLTTPAPASDASAAPPASYGTPEVPYDDFTTYGGYDATGFTSGSAAGLTPDAPSGHFPGGTHATGEYATGQWYSDAVPAPAYGAYAPQHQAGYDTGAYDSTAWTVPAQAAGNEVSGQWDAGAWLHPDHSGTPVATQQWEWGTQTFDTGAYDATQWNSAGPVAAAGAEQEAVPYEQGAAPYEHGGMPFQQDGVAYEPDTVPFDQQETATFEGFAGLDGTGEPAAVPHLLENQQEPAPTPVPTGGRAGARAGARSRRRTPAKRSALLTIAVPSACVVGVAGIAVASVGALHDDGSTETTASASDAHAVQPSVANSKLDTQLKGLSAGADDFADRASRTQERIDLKQQQDQEKKKAAAEAALKERLRPKFVLPVLQKGLSAYFGQAGVNWMSVHTGIDFPVAYGTTVMAATDGTVATKWNSAYGNMLILTAKDGTQTWYCHLSRYVVAPGTTVKAGQPIAHSGNSGNSTGPHLHFEVRPGGGAAVDPLPWLRSHGLDPT